MTSLYVWSVNLRNHSHILALNSECPQKTSTWGAPLSI